MDCIKFKNSFLTNVFKYIKNNTLLLLLFIFSFLYSSNLYSQNNRITVVGTIVDEKGESIIGANVVEKGSNSNGTISDLDGDFSLEVAADASLQIIYIGYTTQEIKATDKTKLKIVLKEDIKLLEEVVVTGYQTIAKERSTGSFGLLSAKKMERKLQANLSSLLEGEVSGLTFNKNNQIEIRGISTFDKYNTAPLLVVDGFPVEGSINDLNPNNIANVTILKDGVASSIYGARAANGVIVVTTKKGKGKIAVNYRGTLSVAGRPNLDYLNLASSNDYIDAEREIFENEQSSVYAGWLMNYNMSRVTYLLGQLSDENMQKEAVENEIEQLRTVDGLKQVERNLFRPKTSQQHSISIGGGEDKFSYHLALNYLNEQGAYKHTDYTRTVIDWNNQWNPSSKLSFSFFSNLVLDKRSKPQTDYEDLLAYSIDSKSMLVPYSKLKNADESLANVWGFRPNSIEIYNQHKYMKDYSYNPISDLPENMDNNSNLDLRLGGNLQYKLLDCLDFSFGGVWERGVGMRRQINSANSFIVRTAYNGATSANNDAVHIFPEGALLKESRYSRQSWTVRSQLSFDKFLSEEKHHLNILLGTELRKSTADNNRLADRAGYDEVSGIFIPLNNKDYSNGKYDNEMIDGREISILSDGFLDFRDDRFLSFYSNLSYNPNNKYVLSGSIRMDLVNLFGTDPRYRYRPMWSLGGTYKLSEEDFFNVDWMNRLYIRASYGVNGNIALDNGPFLILYNQGFVEQTEGVAYTISSPPNKQLRWERTISKNIGVDFSFFNGRINTALDFYQRNSDDLLTRHNVDKTTGYSAIDKNEGKLQNRGVELKIDAEIFKQASFQWNSTFVVSMNTNKVKQYGEALKTIEQYTFNSRVPVQGYPITSLWGYRFAGLNEEGRTLLYNKEGEKITSDLLKVEDIVYQGASHPICELSFSNQWRYKQWELSCMMIAKFGAKYRKDAFVGTNYQNRHVKNRWRKAGDEAHTIYPALSVSSRDNKIYPYIDEMIGNASFLKMRDISLSYSLDKQKLFNLNIDQVKLYLQVRNLFRITAKGVDIDPETSDSRDLTVDFDRFTTVGFNSLPLPREFYFGLSISL